MRNNITIRICLILLISLTYSNRSNASNISNSTYSIGSSLSDSLKSLDQIYKPNSRSISLKSTYGYVIPTNDFVRGENVYGTAIDRFSAFDFRYSIETNGSEEWHHIYNFPKYGIGLYNSKFWHSDGEASDELGYPTALYAFLGSTIKRYERSSFNYEVGFGLTWNWNAYNPVENPFNVAIGSMRTVFINFAADYTYSVNSRLDLSGGLNITHFSNGSMAKPNKGMNLISPSIEVKYRLKGDGEKPERRTFIFEEKRDEFYIFGAIGSKQIAWDSEEYGSKYKDISFAVATLSGGWLRQTSHSFKFGGGLDISYDSSMNAEIIETGEVDESGDPIYEKKDFNNMEKVSLGAMGNMEFVMGQVSIVSGVGAYIFRSEMPNQTPTLYQRLGAKYHLKNDMFFGINVRAYNFSVADYIEWSVGYRFRK